MQTILILQNSKTLAELISREIERHTHFKTVCCFSLADAQSALSSQKFLAAIVAMVIEDAESGEPVDFTLSQKIPTIVFTSSYSDTLQKTLWKKPIIDYVIKDNPDNIGYIITLLKRLEKNITTKVLICDDSELTRNVASKLLENHLYSVFLAEDGVTALKVLRDNPDIRLLLTDYIMPSMNGLELIQKVRRKYPKEKLAIIGMTSDSSRGMSAQFIKSGANDFIPKPYLNDEFYCRINQNIETIEHIKEIQHASDTDYLTGLYNRRFLFTESKQYFESTQNDIAVAMFDIDSFKAINDTYGHLDGDAAIISLAEGLKRRFTKSAIICRFGGDELCIFFYDTTAFEPLIELELFRQEVESTTIVTQENNLKITISIGVCVKRKETVEKMINHADQMLYEAKNQGKNVVVIDNELDLS
ncbi:MAG: diguanylate cyclase [Fibrobacterales bacterium]